MSGFSFQSHGPEVIVSRPSRRVISLSSEAVVPAATRAGSRGRARVLSRVVVTYVLAAVGPATAQRADTSAIELPEVRVEASRALLEARDAPMGFSVNERSPEQIRLEPALGLVESLAGMPGLRVEDRGHFAQDERLTVRGMGWRSSFGVRGVQIVLDDVRLTLPDGQAVLDVVDPSMIRRAELIRGPASVFWGNASGGVLHLKTNTDVGGEPSIRVRGVAGSLATRQWNVEASERIGTHIVSGYFTTQVRNGYRDHSAGRRTRGHLRGGLQLGDRSSLDLTGAFVSQDTDNPGALNREELEADYRQSNPLFQASGAGKKSWQGQMGASFRHESDSRRASVSGFGLLRDLDNALPFAYIELNRFAGGFHATHTWLFAALDVSAGLDAGVQRDSRLNYDVEDGVPTDDVTLDQLEKVWSLAGFVSGRFHLGAVSLLGGLRADRISFSNDDRHLANGDDSGDRLFTALSPSIGLALRVQPATVFANVSTAFETPTTTELVNRPSGEGGFNPDLKPQRTVGYEAGIRTPALGGRLFLDVAAFLMNIEDRLVPVEGEDLRTYFVNAGRSRHAGLEFEVTWHPSPVVEMSVTHVEARYTFLDADLDGNQIPGLPERQFLASLRAYPAPAWIELRLVAVPSVFVDNDNTQSSDGYAVVDLRVGARSVRLGSALVDPFVAVSNLLDERYVGSVVANSSSGRYFEPAAGRTVQVGVSVSLGG